MKAEKKEKKRLRKKWIAVITACLLISGCGAAGFDYMQSQHAANDASGHLNEPPATADPSSHTSLIKKLQVTVGQTLSGSSGPVNVLLIGNNARNASGPLSLGTAGGQADILIVAHIDPSSHKVTLISVPRDTLIAMPGWNEPIPKIKSAFELGLQESPSEGPALAMSYVSELTGLPIHDYIVTDFQGFADAIDAVGGLTVTIPARLYDPAHSGADFQPGPRTLNGQEALAYIRIRQNVAGNDSRTNDFQRQDAELGLLELLKEKVLKNGVSLPELQKLYATWNRDIATNLSSAQLIGLGLEVAGSEVDHLVLGSASDSMDISSAALSGVNQEGFLTGAYYDVLDPVQIEQALKPLGAEAASDGLPPLPSTDTVSVDVYGSQDVVSELKMQGFQVHWMGPDPKTDVMEVDYPQGQFMAACAVGRTLGAGDEWVAPSSVVQAVTVYAP